MNKNNIDKKSLIYLTISIVIAIFSILAFGVYKLESSMAVMDFSDWICTCVETGGGTGFANENACRTTCETYGGGFVSFEAPSTVAVTSVSCDMSSTRIKVGGHIGLALHCSAQPSNATTKFLQFSSSNTSVATVSLEDGIVDAVGVGTATVTVRTVDGNYTTTIQITVYDDPVCDSISSIAVEEGSAVLDQADQELDLTIKCANGGNPANKDDITVTTNRTDLVDPLYAWFSNGEGRIIVERIDGGTKSGTATVTATYKGQSKSINISIPAIGGGTTPTTYKLTYNNNDGSGCTSKTATAGNSWGTLCTPTRSGYTFKSWNTKSDGTGTTVTSSTKANSNTTVYAQWTKNSDPVVPVTGVSLNRTTWKLGIGEQITISATVTPNTATNKNISRWTTNNVSAATISSTSGSSTMVTGVSEGEAAITATTEDGEKKAVSRITVVGSSTTAQIMDARLGTLKKLINATESNIHKDQDIEKDSDGNLVYPFGLGCMIGEDKCFDDVIYSNKETSMVDETGKSITLTEIKNKWNADPYINTGKRWDLNYMNNGEATIAIDKIKGKYSATYKNVNKSGIDVKATIVDFEPMQDQRYMISQPAIVITNKKMGVAVTGIKWVKIKYQFIDSATNTTISKKGNTTYWDVDENQGVIVDSDGTNKGIFFVNHGLKYNNLTTKTVDTDVDNQLYYKNMSDGFYIFDQDSGLDQTKKNPLYNDLLNSVSYAFTEEFEGDSITRTFQYSNPVFINTPANERVWNGHGGVFISSTPVRNDEQYVITTEVENGEITDSTPAYEGETVTITYSPDSGYELSYIEVDNERIEITNDNKDKYVFSNIVANHHIKVVYEKISNPGGVPSPKTGIFEVGGVLIAVLAIGGTVYYLTKKKQISNI